MSDGLFGLLSVIYCQELAGIMTFMSYTIIKQQCIQQQISQQSIKLQGAPKK